MKVQNLKLFVTHNGVNSITISSKWSIYKHLQRGELVQILHDYPIAANTAIWVVYPSSRLLDPKVRAFIDYFTEYFGDTPYWE
jgi:DNA-binding transcriptional LysR family regulator